MTGALLEDLQRVVDGGGGFTLTVSARLVAETGKGIIGSVWEHGGKAAGDVVYGDDLETVFRQAMSRVSKYKAQVKPDDFELLV